MWFHQGILLVIRNLKSSLLVKYVYTVYCHNYLPIISPCATSHRRSSVLSPLVESQSFAQAFRLRCPPLWVLLCWKANFGSLPWPNLSLDYHFGKLQVYSTLSSLNILRYFNHIINHVCETLVIFSTYLTLQLSSKLKCHCVDVFQMGALEPIIIKHILHLGLWGPVYKINFNCFHKLIWYCWSNTSFFFCIKQTLYMCNTMTHGIFVKPFLKGMLLKYDWVLKMQLL